MYWLILACAMETVNWRQSWSRESKELWSSKRFKNLAKRRLDWRAGLAKSEVSLKVSHKKYNHFIFPCLDRGFAFSQEAGHDHLVTDELNKNLKQKALQRNLFLSVNSSNTSGGGDTSFLRTQTAHSFDQPQASAKPPSKNNPAPITKPPSNSNQKK